jgi:transposase
MTRYIGLDVHKRFIEVCIIDAAGKVLYRGQVVCDKDQLEKFCQQRFKKSDHAVLEATGNTWSIVAIVQPFVERIVVSNPLRTKAIAEAKIKTDKVDALVLAQLLRCDFLPLVWQPNEETQRFRGLMTHRTGLMTHRSRIKNRIQSLLARWLLKPPCKVLWTKTGMLWLKSVLPKLPVHEQLALESDLRQLEQVDKELVLLDQKLASSAQEDPRVQLLMTLPGVNYAVALGLLAALGDISRFRDGDHAASYLGLVPSTRQSANHCYHGHITKAGNGNTRWLLTQAAQHVGRHAGPLGAFFRRLANRKNRNVAISATARKLVSVALLMLKNNEPYRYARPDLMRKKFSCLGQAATGARARILKGKSKPGLEEVYDAAKLPKVTTPAKLSRGERRMLEDRKLMEFVEELYQPISPQDKTKHTATKATRTPRRTKAAASQGGK